MNFKPIPKPKYINFSDNQKEKFPFVDQKILWQSKPSEFNKWRRKYDFPRIVEFFKKNLKDFKKWQKEQKISDKELIYFGPARFLKENKNKVYIVEFKKEDIEDFTRIIEYKEELIKIKKMKDFRKINKTFIPYLSWARKNKIIPHKNIHNYKLKSDSKHIQNKLVISYILKDLPLIFLGNVQLNELEFITSLCGSNNEIKNLEFTCLDNLKLTRCNNGGKIRLDFCSAENIIIRNSHITWINAYNTSFDGLNVENSNLQDWNLTNCSIFENFIEKQKEYIKNSKITKSKFTNTRFFRNHEFLTIEKTDFTFNSNDEKSFENLKNIYSKQGDFFNADKYYYLQKKSNIKNKLSFFQYYKEDLPHPKKIVNNIKSIILNLKEKRINKTTFIKNISYIVFFRLKLLFNPKYLLLLLKNYISLFFNFLELLYRGFGVKPIRIFISLFFVILGTSIFDLFYTNIKFKFTNIINLVLINILYLIGQGEYNCLDSSILCYKILLTLFGIISISFIVADYSAKRRY